MITLKRQHGKNEEENVSSPSISIKYKEYNDLQIQKEKGRANDKCFISLQQQICGKMHHFKALYKSVYFSQNCEILIYSFIF